MKKEQIFGIIRHTLTFVGGILVMNGIGDESVFAEIAGGAMGLVAAVWSLFEKKA
jgi:hypothetical protein